MTKLKSCIYKLILDILAEERPIYNQDLNLILNDEQLYKEFILALQKSRNGKKTVTFRKGQQEYTIELVKDLEPAL